MFHSLFVFLCFLFVFVFFFCFVFFCLFVCFFSILWQGRGIYPFHILCFIMWSDGTAKSTILQNLFCVCVIIRSGCLAEIRWSARWSKSHRSLSFSRTDARLCNYHLFVWSNFKFLAHLLVDHLAYPVVSSLILLLCKFAAFAYVIEDFFLSLHSLHLLFCCVLSILALMWLVLIALFCAAIWRDSVSLS